MKKNGFTLIELIAVIAILGLMGILVSPAVLKIREDSLRNSLEGKISMIKSAGVEYASDNLMNLHAKVPTTPEEENCNKGCIESNGVIANSSCGTNSCESFCNKILVRTLIEQGYISGDSGNKNELTNPLSNVSLNNAEVCITFDKYTVDRKIAVYIKNENNLFDAE